MKLLSWIVHARRPLETTEVQHALAIRPGARGIYVKYLPEVEDMASDSAGLVIIDEESGTIRLVHFTTQDYFERTCAKWFPHANAYLAEACGTYLSFDAFDAYDYWKGPDSGSNCEYPLYNYAANHVGYHARESTSEAPILSVVDFL